VVFRAEPAGADRWKSLAVQVLAAVLASAPASGLAYGHGDGDGACVACDDIRALAACCTLDGDFQRQPE